MAYYPGKQPPQKTQPLMGGNPQMQVGGYKNPSQLGPTTPGPVSGTYQPEPWSNEQGMAPVSGQDWNPGGSQGGGSAPINEYGQTMPSIVYDDEDDLLRQLGMTREEAMARIGGGAQGGPQANRSGYSPKPYPQPKPGPYRQDPNAPMYKALRSAMYQQKQPNEGLPSGWGKTMDERNLPVYGPRQAGAYNAMFVGRPAGRMGGGGGFDTGFQRGSEDDWRSLYAQRDSLTPGSAAWGRLVTGANAYNPRAAGTSGYRGTQGSLPQTSGSGSAYALLNALNQRNG